MGDNGEAAERAGLVDRIVPAFPERLLRAALGDEADPGDAALVPDPIDEVGRLVRVQVGNGHHHEYALVRVRDSVEDVVGVGVGVDRLRSSASNIP